MKFLLVPVIMVCALAGTVGMLKLISRFFPGASGIERWFREWTQKQEEARTEKEQE